MEPGNILPRFHNMGVSGAAAGSSCRGHVVCSPPGTRSTGTPGSNILRSAGAGAVDIRGRRGSGEHGSMFRAQVAGRICYLGTRGLVPACGTGCGPRSRPCLSGNPYRAPSHVHDIMFQLDSDLAGTKQDLYLLPGRQLSMLIEGEHDFIVGAASFSSLLYHLFPDVNRAGFYILRGGYPIPGPFQGKPGCTGIALGFRFRLIVLLRGMRTGRAGGNIPWYFSRSGAFR